MRSFRAKPVGWRNESYRHYLAAKGIRTRYDAKKYGGFGRARNLLLERLRKEHVQFIHDDGRIDTGVGRVVIGELRNDLYDILRQKDAEVKEVRDALDQLDEQERSFDVIDKGNVLFKDYKDEFEGKKK